MSADSPRRVTGKGNAGHVVLPQPVTDHSLIDSVTGFIQEVVPQAYGGSTTDSREVITWVRVQQADINDPALYPDTGEQDGVPPLLLVLGYGSGVQVWLVPVTGEAREVLSWSQGSVRVLHVLPTPEALRPPRQDLFKHKRPLVAMVDNAGPGPQFCAVNFISLRYGDQVKSINFSHQVWDVVANRRSVVVSLAERIAVFDAATMEDKLSITTCYPSPETNPVALGSRWLAYADRRLTSHWRSLGGCHSECSHSVTSTMFHAAKFLGKGLRDLSETVASSLTGSSPENTSLHHTHPPEPRLKGIVTIVDIEYRTKLPKDANEEDHHQTGANKTVAHFNAHFEPIVALNFDPSGMLLLSADKHGHRFHVFRINPHPCGPTLAYVQHLYILHRGDTTARIQDITFSADSRWVAISSMRGTTHVFPITPYGGPVGVRTHTSPQVVNKLSRFHRSAGLTDEGRNSPVLWEGPPPSPPATLPLPTTVTALSQVRRQTLISPTEDCIVRVAACFGAPRAPALAPHPRTRRAMDSLFVMGCNGTLIQYDLEPRHFSGVSKEKVCDDTSIELHVEARAEWVLQRPPYSSSLHPPLACTNPLLSQQDPPTPTDSQADDERWLSQVEIVTHAGPHRRLWMGPQFTFITVNSNNEPGDALDISKQVVRSNPVNMPHKQPLIIESGSCSSLDMSPNMVELVYKTDCNLSCQLRDDLAEAMQESPTGRSAGVKGAMRREPVIERQVNPLGSVVTLTAQLNFPANLLTKDGRVTVVGTETKKITLESRFNKPLMKTLLNECLLNENALDSCSKFVELETASIDLGEKPFKLKQKTCDYDSKSSKKVLAEVDENVSNYSNKIGEKDEISERRGKSGKVRRKISKGEKNKSKPDTDLKEPEEILTLPAQDLPASQVEMDMPVEGMLQGSGDIEMQLREASIERDLEEIFLETDDSKGRKRSLDITLETKTFNLSDKSIFVEADKYTSKNTQENDKMSSRQRKKSKMNDQDAWLNKSVSDDKITDTSVDKFELKDVSEASSMLDKTFKVEEKIKNKKKKSRKSSSNDSTIDDQLGIESSLGVKKMCDSDIEQAMLAVSQETLCPDTVQDSLDSQKIAEEVKTNAVSEISECLSNIENETVELNSVEDKNIVTDDELKGFESDLLVKDSSIWSPEKSPERDMDVLMDDKDSDKEIDKVKNEETTDKDSSDDCQPIVIKPDSKHAQKRGKNRKIMRKVRELETKMLDNETRYDENLSPEDLTKLETVCIKNDEDSGASVIKDEIGKDIKKVDSEEEDIFVETNKNLKTNMFMFDFFPELKVSTDGVKRRIRKRETPEKELETSISSLLEVEVPKRSWSSIVSSKSEDTNENLSKPDEPIAPIRSWSNIAAGPAKPKTQDTETTKTNSVEDRDSVYESCNDSVGEEIEPALDSLSSCYFEPETKDDTSGLENTSQYKKEEVSPESKSGSSLEDKSNTDSGEKEDLIVGTQTTTKKSKKQKKKKR